MPALSRRHIVRCCKQRGWSIQPLALQGILDLAESEDDVEAILDQLAPSMRQSSRTVTDSIWNNLIEIETDQAEVPTEAYGSSRHGLESKNNDSGPMTASNTKAWAVVNAFETPKLVYEVMRKQFSVEERRYSLFGTAEDKTNMLSQRYAFLHQRLLRHEFFRPTDLSRSSARLKIIPIESLLGSAQDQSVLLLGLLLQIEEGQWYLEDPSGQIPISFQCLSQIDDFFVTEHCILVVEGRLDDGIFYVEHVGNPVLEERKTSLAAIRQQLSHPAYSTTAKCSPPENSDSSSFVFVSDAHLDLPRTIQHLEALLARYEKFSAADLPVFVIMGNFSSAKENPAPMEELASLILTFSNLRRHGRFVLVPGPDDAPGYTLPAANTLSRSGGFGRIANVEWATNPCRIRNRSTGREIVVFRYDLLHLFQRQQLLLKHGGTHQPPGLDDDDMMTDGDGVGNFRRVPVEPHVRLIKTMLGQGHMIPVSGVPVAWNYDHSLRLYPLPDVLVLGGDGPGSGRFHEVYEGCHVLHPGSMVDGSFAAYSEANGDDDDDADDDGDAETGPRVEFGQLGVES